MIKTFARWLFMKTHKAQLLEVKRYIEIGMEPVSSTGLRNIDWKASEGALEVLTVLDLLVKKNE